MPIVQGSSMMSLGTWTARSSKYQKFLNLSNVFMLITSTTLIFLAVVLIKFYHITKLDFWSPWFYWNPTVMVCLGLYTFAVSVYSFLISNHENRCFISMTAIFFSLAFLVQLFSVFMAMELRYIINNNVIPPGNINNEMRHYGLPDQMAITAKWDEMQTELRCCGGEQFETGWMDWKISTRGLPVDNVPDSCCQEYEKGCGAGVLRKQSASHLLGIYQDGCLAILKIKLKNEVVPLMIVYTCVGVLLAMVELVTVALACAYVAQISRRKKCQDIYSRAATAANDDEANYLPSLNSKETNF